MKKYLVNFSEPIHANGSSLLPVMALDAESAQEKAIDTLDAAGVCVPSIRSIKAIKY